MQPGGVFVLEAYTPGQVRTLQRHIRQWRAQRGPEREIFFPQTHRPGEAQRFQRAEFRVVHLSRRGHVWQV